MKLLKKATFATLLLASVAACTPAPNQEWNPTPTTEDGVSINDDYINGSMAFKNPDLPTMGDGRNLHRLHHEKLSPKRKASIDKIRNAAQTYGLQLGLSYANSRINLRLNQHAAELSKIYDFHNLLLMSPTKQLLLPPVISEADDTWEVSNDGRSLQVADKTYSIDEDAQFVKNSPLWHTYLFRSYNKPEVPADDSLPSDQYEQDIWDRYYSESYNKGVRQALDIFRDDIRKLNHDFVGMRRYKELLDEGRISAPYFAASNLGVTGSEKRVSINHKVLNITGMPHLNYDHPDKIQASVSTETAPEAAQTPPLDDELTSGIESNK